MQKTFTIQLTDQQLELIGQLLSNAPYKIAFPLVNSINQQLASQLDSSDES